METTIQQPLSTTFISNTAKPSFLHRFLHWCEHQEHNRFGWLAAALATHGCALTPITLFSIILSGNNIIFWIIALVAMGMSLVTNLAAMPTKITIPVFVLSILIDVTLIIYCASLGFNIAGTYV